MKTLILIDLQKGFDDPKWGIRNNPSAELNAKRLLEKWRELRYPIVHVQHSSLESDSPLRSDRPGFHFKNETSPAIGEMIVTKNVNSAFIGTNLESYLKVNNFLDLLFVGLTTDHCISTTVRMASNLGFEVTLIHDAIATFNRIGLDGRNISADEIHRIHLSSLNGEFCQVLSTDEVMGVC